MSKIYMSKVSFKKGFTTFDKRVLRSKLHGFVMGFFPVAESSNPREEFNVLWSLETDRRGADYLLIQSSVPLARTEGPTLNNRSYTVETISLSFIDRLEEGSKISYRIHINPVRASENKRIAIKGKEEIVRWWVSKIENYGLKPIAQELLSIDVSELVKGSSHRFTVSDAVIVGKAEVINPALLKKSIVSGIGRAKSYGCGLMLIGR